MATTGRFPRGADSTAGEYHTARAGPELGVSTADSVRGFVTKLPGVSVETSGSAVPSCL